MARKKKVKIVKANTQISQQPVSYEGKVTLKVMRGGYVLKTYEINNSGTLLLFTGIARYLAGQFSTNLLAKDMTSYIPQFLGIGGEETVTATNPFRYTLSSEHNITRFKLEPQNVIISNDGSSVIAPFVTTIFYTSVGEGKKITELGLFSSPAPHSPTMVARITIPDGGITLESGMNLLVE